MWTPYRGRPGETLRLVGLLDLLSIAAYVARGALLRWLTRGAVPAA